MALTVNDIFLSLKKKMCQNCKIFKKRRDRNESKVEKIKQY